MKNPAASKDSSGLIQPSGHTVCFLPEKETERLSSGSENYSRSPSGASIFNPL